MNIHANFPGGNIRINRIEGDDIYLEQEIRDTVEWWFYWAFCVEGAQGHTLCFHFENRDVLGYYGPCISADDWDYAWAGEGTRLDGHTFVYTFGQGEEKCYFRYSIPYQLRRFETWASVQTFPKQRRVLCQSEKGRAVPYYVLGDPNAQRSIYFTSRHHACESVATFVLEGACSAMMDERARLAALGCNLVVIPFVDLDGVEDGDQGKSRNGHDHNRDYCEVPVYAANRAMTGLTATHSPLSFVDFHCPWYLGNENDHLYIVKGEPEDYVKMDRFSELLIRHTALDPLPDAIRYNGLHDIRAGEKWLPKEPTPTTSSSFFRRQGAQVACSLEVPYFGIDTVFTADNTRRLGGAVARALLDLTEEWA